MILLATIFAAALAIVFLAALIYKSIKALRRRQSQSCTTEAPPLPTAPTESECKRPPTPPPSYAAVVEEDRVKAEVSAKGDQAV